MRNANARLSERPDLPRGPVKGAGAAGAAGQRRQLPGPVRSRRRGGGRRARDLRHHPGHRLRRGLAVDGRLVEGGDGVAGEWGHMPLPWPEPDESPGPQCWCGQKGCLETWVSGTGLRRDFKAVTGRDLDGPGDRRGGPGRRAGSQRGLRSSGRSSRGEPWR
ncbi:ROK family protein [Caulobacter segnis]